MNRIVLALLVAATMVLAVQLGLQGEVVPAAAVAALAFVVVLAAAFRARASSLVSEAEMRAAIQEIARRDGPALAELQAGDREMERLQAERELDARLSAAPPASDRRPRSEEG